MASKIAARGLSKVRRSGCRDENPEGSDHMVMLLCPDVYGSIARLRKEEVANSSAPAQTPLGGAGKEDRKDGT
jgi:hypothetical protein